MARAVEVRPLPAGDALEVQPRRAAQVARVAHQALALQVGGKELFAEVDRLLHVGSVEPVCPPHVLGAFDDEGAGRFVELVDVRLEPAVLGLLEQEGEGVVALGGAQPDVAVGPRDDIGLEHRRMARADLRVDAVAGDDQVGIGEFEVAVHVALEHQFHPQRLAARLQDVEQLLAPDADEAVAARSDHPALEVQRDVVPVVEGALDLRGRHRVAAAHVLHRRVGEDHAPAEGVVRAVALHHGDAVRRIELLHQQCEIQAGRAAADADDIHACSDQAPQQMRQT